MNRSLKQTPSMIQNVSLLIITALVMFTLASTIKFNLIPYVPYGSIHFDLVSNIKSVMRRYENQDKKSSPTDFFNGWKSLYLCGACFLHLLVIIEKSAHSLNIKLSEYNSYLESMIIDYLMRCAIDVMCLNVVLTAIVGAIAMIPFIDGAKNLKKLFLSLTIIRYLRLIPIVSFVMMMIIVAPLLTIRNSGIFHEHIMQTMSDTCSTYGALEVLFIGNFIHPTKICLIVGWFLSADFQLAIITFPLLIALARNIKSGIKLAFLYIIAGIGIEYAIHMYFNTVIVPKFEDESSYETIAINHFWTTNYVSTFAIGLIFGTLIYRNIRLSEKFYMKYNLAIWMVTMTVLTATTFTTMNIDDWTCDRWITNFVASIIRTIGTICLSILIYMVWMSDKDNIVRNILSFSPLLNSISKILLPSFLLHSIALTWVASLFHSEAIEYNVIHLISRAIVIYPFSILIGLILHIFIEIPFMKLLKSVFINRKKVE